MFHSKVLVIEDEATIASSIKRILAEQEGVRCDVRIAHDGEEGLKQSISWKPDVVVLDLGLPRLHGMHILRRIHQELKQVKVCIISAAGKLEDRLLGFEEGTDDYLVKPFAAEELRARVMALLRRGRVYDQLVLMHEDLCVQVPTRTVTRSGRTCQLTKMEFDLLLYLMQRPDQVVSRDELLEQVWEGKDRYPNTVDAHIESLRQKVDKPFSVKYIYTAYREGYYFNTHLQ